MEDFKSKLNLLNSKLHIESSKSNNNYGKQVVNVIINGLGNVVKQFSQNVNIFGYNNTVDGTNINVSGTNNSITGNNVTVIGSDKIVEDDNLLLVGTIQVEKIEINTESGVKEFNPFPELQPFQGYKDAKNIIPPINTYPIIYSIDDGEHIAWNGTTWKSIYVVIEPEI